jgi:hypothetical protein
VTRSGQARVELVQVPQSGHAPDGSVTSRQVAEVSLPPHDLVRLWSPENLERLARTYWRFLTRVSLGVLRVLYTPSSREIVVVRRPLVLLRFFAPEYEVGPGYGSVTWRIDKGVLVAPRGRGKGYLRIAVRRESDSRVTVSSEVANFYPAIAGSGWFSRVGRAIYRVTQLRIHVIVTNAFLRSLARLDLEQSVIGRLAPPRAATPGARR